MSKRLLRRCVLRTIGKCAPVRILSLAAPPIDHDDAVVVGDRFLQFGAIQFEGKCIDRGLRLECSGNRLRNRGIGLGNVDGHIRLDIRRGRGASRYGFPALIRLGGARNFLNMLQDVAFEFLIARLMDRGRLEKRRVFGVGCFAGVRFRKAPRIERLSCLLRHGELQGDEAIAIDRVQWRDSEQLNRNVTRVDRPADRLRRRFVGRAVQPPVESQRRITGLL